jgi:signal transduction histidine kinase
MSTFQTRARTVEMLGRQQIAGIPTAISEIFKNAHDAYADHVEADFLPRDQLLVIRDDGYGMTLEDFESRWLTLGTDSKVSGGIGFPDTPKGQSPRVMLGEKGIGRLAVAIIGPQVLILTRALRGDTLDDLVAAFVNWAAFDLPGINLNEVEIPTRRFPGGTIPTAEDVQDLVQMSLSNLESFGSRTDDEKLKATTDALVEFALDVSEIANSLEGLSLSGQGHGTHFYIAPTNPALASDLEPPAKSDQPSLLFQSLIGFSNTMTTDHQTPSLSTVFRHHKRPGFIEDVISSAEFFTPEEFLQADHHFVGKFDESGQFVGTASVYGQETPYVIPWRGGRGLPLACGPFRLSLGIIQGKAIESHLSADDYSQMSRKLGQIGGLYIYKDDVRVLPYGRQDYDYLDIEQNRSKSAGYYYYSYRNIFGAVELNAENNPGLREKAGREGFQDNAAWRDFRSVLKNFFLQSAADFFRSGGTNTEIFERQKEELNRIERARREREKQVRERRRKFLASLDRSLTVIAQGEIESVVQTALTEFQSQIASAVVNGDSGALLDAEEVARRALTSARSLVTVTLPRGLAMSPSARRDWAAFQNELGHLEEALFGPASEQVTAAVDGAASAIGVHVDRRRRVASAVQEIATESQQDTRAAVRRLDDALTEFQTRTGVLRGGLVGTVSVALDTARERVESTDYAKLTDEELVGLRLDLEDSIRLVAGRAQSALESVTAQIEGIVWETDETGEIITAADMSASAEEEIMALRERSEQDLEMAQLGMAVSVIDHEFQATIRSIRAGLRRLKAWSDLNPKLDAVYSELRISFDHLDGYLTLFTPLQRRLRRTKTELRGAEIFSFLQTLFGERLENDEIDFESTSPFKKATVIGFASTFYPVFVNLVDNAIFWLENINGLRTISLGVDDGHFLVSDTGPGIPIRDREAVFEPGFTRRPGGRGLGLSISRQALRAAGFDLTLDRNGLLGGATFRISTTELGDR